MFSAYGRGCNGIWPAKQQSGGGIYNGSYFYKKDSSDIIYSAGMDITGSIYGIKTGFLDGKTVSAAFGTGCKRRIVNSRRYIRQTVRGY